MRKSSLLLLVLVCASSIWGSDFKLAYISIDRVFGEAKPAKAIQELMKNKLAAPQEELQNLNALITNEQGALQELIKKQPDINKLNKNDKNQALKQQMLLQKNQASFQQKYMNYQQKVQIEQECSSSVLLNQANSILKVISEKAAYDLVLSSNQLVYAKTKYDITDALLAELNKVEVKPLLSTIDQCLNNKSMLPRINR